MAVEWTFERPLTAADCASVGGTPPDIVVRAMRRDDAARLHAVYLDAFSTRTDAPLDMATWVTKWPLHALCVPDLSYVANSDGDAVGYLLGYVDPDADAAAGWIGQIGVRVLHRETGIATALIRTAVARLARRGFARAALHVAPDNANAIRLYETLGFRRRPD